MRRNPRPATAVPVGTPRDSHDMYASTARISSPSRGRGLPFMERSKQSLIRSSRSSTLALRLEYSGKSPQMPAHGAAQACRPRSRWQLVQCTRAPTYALAYTGVWLRIRSPWRIASPSGPSGIDASLGGRAVGDPALNDDSSRSSIPLVQPATIFLLDQRTVTVRL